MKNETPQKIKSPRRVCNTHRGPHPFSYDADYITRPVEIILRLLKKVKKVGDSKWLACCPAHQDKSPSLSIKELTGNEVLIHCFAGCETKHVMQSIGLQLRDLFPRHPDYQYTQHKAHRFTALELLHLAHYESLITLIAANSLSQNIPLSAPDLQRLGVAVKTLEAALREVENGYS